MRRIENISPIRVFLIVLAVAFAVEMSIMVVMETLDPPRPQGMWLSLLDAVVLVMVLCPVIWLLLVKPLRKTLIDRSRLMAHLLTLEEDERAKLARDLHDELGQTQTAVLLGARSITSATSLNLAHERAEEVARTAAIAIEATRRLTRGLSPMVLIDLGLAAAAERLCEDIAAAGAVPIDCTIDLGAGRPPREIEIALYRVLQEALTNTVKHARASRVQVTLQATSEAITLTIADDGRGLPTNGSGDRSGGMGMANMRERVGLLNGTLAVQSAPNRGTTITSCIPLPPTGRAA